MNGATLEEWVRKFAGPVGKNPGQLQAALNPNATNGHTSAPSAFMAAEQHDFGRAVRGPHP